MHVSMRAHGLMCLLIVLQEQLPGALARLITARSPSLHKNQQHTNQIRDHSGHLYRAGTMRNGHKADTLQRRRRRIKFIVASCVAVVLIYLLAGSPTVPPLRRSSARSRSLLLLDTPPRSDELLQQHLIEQPQRAALLARLQQAVRRLWHGPPAADAMPTELATCLADTAMDKATAYTIDDFVAGRPARCTPVLTWCEMPLLRTWLNHVHCASDNSTIRCCYAVPRCLLSRLSDSDI